MNRFTKSIAILVLISWVTACSVVQSLQGTGEQSAQPDADVQTDIEQLISVPDRFLNDYNQVLALISGEYYDQAEAELFSLIEVYPEYSGPWVNLAIVYLKTGDDDQVVPTLEAALQINPDNIDACNLLAIEYRKLGQFDKAGGLYLHAIELSPEDAMSHLNVAILYDLYMGNWQQALTHYESYRSYEDDDRYNPRVDGWIVDLERRIERRIEGQEQEG